MFLCSDQEELDFVVTIEGRENGFCFLTPDLMPYVKLDVANLSSLPTSLPKPHAKCGEFDFVPFGKNRHYFL